MIDPENITNYNLTNEELEEHILFWVCAAGKNGRTAARCLDKFLGIVKGTNQSPFEALWLKGYEDATVFRLSSKYINIINKHKCIPEIMKSCGIGCFNQKARTFIELANSDLDLKACTAEDLEKIYGIGMKTSRCFILHSRKDARYAGLDTHILKYLRAKGVENVPKTTPGSKKEYLRLEKEFLRLADEVDMSPADLDLTVWRKYSIKSEVKA
jgi:hypothetical protein